MIEERIAILAPTGRDAALAHEMLVRAGLHALVCADAQALGRALEEGAGAAVLAEEALGPLTVRALVETLGRQEPWSDLPLLIFALRGEAIEGILNTMGALGNATVLERPVRTATFVSAARTALRARRRQYETRELLRRLSDSDRRKDEFLAMLGHELRNPLGAIRTALEVLHHVGTPDPRAVRQRAVIDRQTRNLGRIVDDLLEVSRITQGKIRLQRQTVPLQELTERAVQALESEAREQGHTLSLHLPPEPLAIDADPVRIEQILSNLVHNSIKYTPRGGRIDVTVESTGSEALLRVRDTGLGIPPEMLPRIFEAFTQVQSSLDRSRGGLGLGLPLVRALAQLHGGSIDASSDGPGRGSEFVLRLPLSAEEPAPLAEPQPEPAAAEPHAAASPVRKLHVLVVEDNPDGRDALCELLQLWGHQVETAVTGHEGVRKALEQRPEAALVDIGLPELDGYEVARRIRAGLDGAPLLLVAITGYGQPEDTHRAQEAGFDRHLVKPVNPQELARMLEGL